MKSKKMYCMLLALVMMVSSVVPLLASPADLSVEYEFTRNHSEAMESWMRAELHNHLVAEYGHEFANNYQMAIATVRSVSDSFMQTRMGATIYPECFGGMYIDADGNAVILTVVSAARHMFTDNATLALDHARQLNEIEVRYVNFSYRVLRDAFSLLNSMPLDAPAIQNAQSWFLDVVNNRIVVQLADFSYEQVAYFRRTIMDLPFIVFEEAPIITFEASPAHVYDHFESYHVESYDISPFANRTINPGQLVLDGSVGFRARTNGAWGARGYVTAAHIAIDVGNSMGFQMGTVYRIQHNFIDAAFVALPFDSQMTNQVFNLQHSTHSREPVTGEIVVIRGRNSLTTPRSSRVHNPRARVSMRGNIIHDTVLVENQNEHFGRGGDSGGIVLSGRDVVGIHIGTHTGDIQVAVIVLASAITGWLDLLIY